MATRKSNGDAAAGPLSTQRIVQAALEEVAADGLAALSMRKVGQRLGREAMSLYHHFPSKQHLLDAMVDHALASVEEPPADLTPMERLLHSVHSYRRMAHRFPALYPLVAVHRLNTPTGVRFIESILALIQAVVPDPELSARYFRAIGYYLTGAGLDETSGYAKGPSAAEPASDDFVVRECPRLVGVAQYFQPAQWDATFAIGVDALMSAMERDAARVGRVNLQKG
ncbi:TetR/AcrR family transcriptional regulator [Variovorax humicola]|uniref:TetR/AcrR family transcriptional regulator n=1 Tax=Variovorax humicola TaxID=1769758 RepID=A0ABU8VZG1_9BURK